MKKFLKQFSGIMMGLLIIGGVFAAVQQRNNSKLELSQFRMLFTDNGKPLGAPIMDINTGGNIIAYGPLVDGAMNPYITGYTETDPIWMIDSGNYIPRTETGTYYQIMPSTRIQDAGANYIMQGTDISISALGGEFRTLGIGLSISIDSGYGAIMDNRTSPRGIEYWNDYSAGFTDYSLVHKKYVAENYMSIADSGTYVPYTGATTDVYLGGNSIYASNAYLQFGGMGVVRTAGGLRAALGGIGEGTFYVANTNTGVILDVNQLTQDRTISFPDATGTIMLDTTMSGYIPRTSIDTGFNNTGSDTIVASEKATYQQILSMMSAQGWSTSGNIGTAGMVFGMTNDYRLQFIMSGQNAGYIDSIGGNRNTFYGALAGDSASTAQNNVGIGFGALTNSSAGNRNACVGYLCLNQNTNGTDNSCVGVYCMQSNNGGSYNSSIGDESLQNNIDGDFNTAIGMSAGNGLTGGDKNTFIGNFANITGGNVSFSTAIGYNAKVRTSHMMQLGDTTLTRLTTRAKFGIGVIDPQYALDVSGAIASHSLILSDVAGVSCATTGQIIFSGSNFLGCDGVNRKQLDN